MQIVKELTIDLYNKISYPIMTAKQNDRASRGIKINLVENGTKYIIPVGAVAKVNIKKPDNTYIHNFCSIEDNCIIIELTSQALAVSGRALVDIELEIDKEILSSATFVLQIDESARNESSIISENQSTVIEKVIAKIEETIAESVKQNTDAKGYIEKIKAAINDLYKRIDDGEFAPSVKLGDVEIVDYDKAGVTNISTDPQNAVFNIRLPTVKVEVASTDTIDENCQAAVFNVGNEHDVKLKFDIPKGEKGDRGDSGIVVPVNGLFTLAGDENGDLWVYYNDSTDPPQFETDENGNIYYVTPDE